MVLLAPTVTALQTLLEESRAYAGPRMLYRAYARPQRR